MSNAEGILVFPFRHHQTFQRRDTWILIFTSPAHAKRYQQRAFQLQNLQARNSSGPWSSSIHFPFGTPAQGQNDRMRLPDYTLTTPFQNMSLVAKPSPFDSKLQRAIRIHKTLVRPRRAEGQFFPVRLYLDRSGCQQLSVQCIRRLLKLDCVARGSWWAIMGSSDAVIRVECNSACELSQVNLGTPPVLSSSIVAENWCINFRHASDAKQFVRLWHRRPLPRLHGIEPHSIILKAECLF